jgi:hypothetical protein
MRILQNFKKFYYLNSTNEKEARYPDLFFVLLPRRVI